MKISESQQKRIPEDLLAQDVMNKDEGSYKLSLILTTSNRIPPGFWVILLFCQIVLSFLYKCCSDMMSQ